MNRSKTCECADPGCPTHTGKNCGALANLDGMTLYRIDMDDDSGTVFCLACAADAFDSGVFTYQDPDDAE